MRQCTLCSSFLKNDIFAKFEPDIFEERIMKYEKYEKERKKETLVF